MSRHSDWTRTGWSLQCNDLLHQRKVQNVLTSFDPIPGVSSEFLVSTCNAGSGALSVTIDGPSKVKMDCAECAEGYKVTYTPMAPGSYLISIRYGGLQHIVGSPFKAKVSGERRIEVQWLSVSRRLLVRSLALTSPEQDST